jgi:hypothetical protein
MRFEFHAYRFRLETRTAIAFAPAQSGNLLRGAFGTLLRRHACRPDCPGARLCPDRARCAYARIFEPVALEKGPSGLADPPRPFLFRASHLDGRRLEPGEPFHFDVHIFYPEAFGLEHFTAAFGELAEAGIGPGRGRAWLVSVESAGLTSLSLEPPAEAVSRLRLRFLTPTELKSEGVPVRRPEFGVLLGRVRDRISTLRALYGPGPLGMDFRAAGERAARVRLERCRLDWVEVARHSSRTGQTHGLGGFVGEAEYAGELTEFVPLLTAGQWTGVGRHTVWGNGHYEMA